MIKIHKTIHELRASIPTVAKAVFDNTAQTSSSPERDKRLESRTLLEAKLAELPMQGSAGAEE